MEAKKCLSKVGILIFLPVAALFFVLQTQSESAQGSDKDMQQRLERLEGLVQEQRRMLENFEKEMNQLKSVLKKQTEGIDEKVQAATKKPEHMEMLKEIMSDIRLTETKQTPSDGRTLILNRATATGSQRKGHPIVVLFPTDSFRILSSNYSTFQRISGALYLDLFGQLVKKEYFRILLII